ncbi:adenylate cyclase, terminal-differentiation specific [Drosophila montana]|uniref:adenylate cyclase, terminal-differentiation specific n=1 Tax=Drosophila montana TaxID=40370 RepID=UPI00313A7DD8
MAKLSETKIPIAEFLEAYRRQPCLYNSLLDTYKNRVAREEAYEAIIRTLKIPQLTVLDIKLKIKSVRTVYTKELRILMREKELGRCYEPKLFWFRRADSFLRAVSLSHCKRVKNKDADVDNVSVDIKKEAPQRMLVNASAELIEDALQQRQQQQQEEDRDELESSVGQPDDAYNTELNEHPIKTTVSTGTNTNKPPNASSQTDDMPSDSSTRAPNKSELIIDDSTLCIMEQEQQQQQQQQQQQTHHQQQQQTAPRKLKYMTYAQNHQSQSQQPHQRLSTPFASPSPSQQLELGSATNHGMCFSGSNGAGQVASSDDDLFVFGQSIASQLRTIPDPYSRSVAKLRIQQVLFEAETGQSSEAVSPHLHSF